jgi:hypothetical protein
MPPEPELPKTSWFDELVISQESQATPVYVVKISSRGLFAWQNNWEVLKRHLSLPPPSVSHNDASEWESDVYIPLQVISSTEASSQGLNTPLLVSEGY